jgi:hypothetical protein
MPASIKITIRRHYYALSQVKRVCTILKNLFVYISLPGWFLFQTISTLYLKLGYESYMQDSKEKEWGFGQILPMMLLLVIPVAMVESFLKYVQQSFHV